MWTSYGNDILLIEFSHKSTVQKCKIREVNRGAERPLASAPKYTCHHFVQAIGERTNERTAETKTRVPMGRQVICRVSVLFGHAACNQPRRPVFAFHQQSIILIIITRRFTALQVPSIDCVAPPLRMTPIALNGGGGGAHADRCTLTTKSYSTNSNIAFR